MSTGEEDEKIAAAEWAAIEKRLANVSEEERKKPIPGLPPAENVVISPMAALAYASELRVLMARVGVENFVRPHAMRDLLDDLSKPADALISHLDKKSAA
jgi:hypothetical protein